MSRRKKVHPIIRQIKAYQGKINALRRAAKLLDVDLSILDPVPLSPDMRRASRMTKKQARRQVMAAFAPPAPIAPPAPEKAPAKRKARRPLKALEAIGRMDF